MVEEVELWAKGGGSSYKLRRFSEQVREDYGKFPSKSHCHISGGGGARGWWRRWSCGLRVVAPATSCEGSVSR